VWDRLPMAVVFMAILAMVIGQWISVPLGRKLFVPLELAGVGSVILWRQTGDLRAYALVQFLPLLLIPVILLLFAGPPRGRRELAMGTGLYILAKILELMDRWIYSWGLLVSGHTLKHLVAAAAIYRVARVLVGADRRRTLAPPPSPRGRPEDGEKGPEGKANRLPSPSAGWRGSG